MEKVVLPLSKYKQMKISGSGYKPVLKFSIEVAVQNMSLVHSKH